MAPTASLPCQTCQGLSINPDEREGIQVRSNGVDRFSNLVCTLFPALDDIKHPHRITQTQSERVPMVGKRMMA